MKDGVGHALVTSASAKVPLIRAVKHAASKVSPFMKVVAGDLDANAVTRYVADAFWHMPAVIDSQYEILAAGCRERGIRTVFPTRDGELLFWSRFHPRFASEGIDVVVSPPASVETCLDKLAFARTGIRLGFPFIPTAEHPSEVGPGPYTVKERFGSGARKLRLAVPLEAALEHGRTLEHAIYQPYIAGREVSVDAWLDRAGRGKGLVARWRDLVVGGESRVTTTFRDAPIEALAMNIFHALDLRGPVVMQMLIDANRDVHVIECNTRFGGASTASIAAGLDVFYWSLLESRGFDVGNHPFDRIPNEIRQVRVQDDIHIHGHHF